ncbi:hypothetical protein M0D69_33815 [Caballeronia sp. SEWSISQ10-4 2]|nr:hypothetical protein [Caballeronia sp. SEWSISQ10-4 2]MDN7182904.1 hypothetical protein [Caballeronia sp. SEWSISQ10-4 2]
MPFIRASITTADEDPRLLQGLMPAPSWLGPYAVLRTTRVLTVATF